MDVKDNVNVNNEQMNSNIENQTLEEKNCNIQERIEKNEIHSKPSEIEENIEKNITEYIAQKEPVEILSNELVISGKEVEDVASEKEDRIEPTINEELDISMRIDNAQQTQEKQKMEEQILEAANDLELVEENMEADDIESSVDVNMKCQIVGETTTQTNGKIEDFSIQSSSILSGIENIQSSVEKKATHLSTESKNLSQPSSGLSLLAQYGSDNDDDDKVSDTDSVIEVPSTSAKDYRSQVVEINSDSDSDDTDSDSDVEYLNEIRKTIEKRIEVADEDDEDDEDNDNGEGMVKKKHKPKLKVKGEMLLEDLPPIQDLQITVAEDECIELGKIHSIIDQLVLVSVLPNAILLDLETVIFLEKGQKVLGEVFDVLGQVADPLYCIRFNSNNQIKEKDIKVGDVVYVAPKTQYTQYVILSSLMKLKGSDASWENDIEPPPRFLDYSDDEQEQMARRQLRNKDRPIDNDEPQKRPRISDEGDQSENRSYTPHHRNRYAQQRDDNSRDKGNGGRYNSFPRPRYNSPNTNQRQQPQQQQQQPNYHRSSWHSNYYPQQYQQAPPQNYGYNLNNRGQSQQNQSIPPPQSYPSQVPMFAMTPMHSMPPYPPPPIYRPQGSAPHMAPQALMPNSFTIRPPTIHGLPPQQQFTSPPLPPGAQ